MLNDASLASFESLMWKVLGCVICKTPVWVLSCKVKAKIYAISSDTHQLQLIKLHHFKLARF